MQQLLPKRSVPFPSWTFGAAVLGAAVLAGGTTFALTNPDTPDKPSDAARRN